MAEKKVPAKASTASKSAVPSRIERIGKKVRSDVTRVNMNKVLHTVSVTTTQLCEVAGIILDLTDNSIAIRHKARAASSKQIVSRFNRDEVAEFIGAVGGPGLVLTHRQVEVRKLPNQYIAFKNGVVIATDANTGEVTEFRRIPGVNINVISEDVKADDSKKSEGKKSEGKSGKKPSGKKSSFED